MAGCADMLSGDVTRWWGGQRGMRKGLNSNAWVRTPAHLLFPAITATFNPSDVKAGFRVHWEEQRVYSLAEARRAQGFRDDESIVGSVLQQFRVVGNSVAREIVLALGLSLRRAVLGTDGAAGVAGAAPEASSRAVGDGLEKLDWKLGSPAPDFGGGVV